MFGRMENTNQAMELQITQEYTGQSRMLDLPRPDVGGGAQDRHLRHRRAGRQAAGRQHRRRLAHRARRTRAIVGVANLGNADNLTGHHFAQANLFAFGPAGVGLDARLGGHRARLGADDLEQRRARRRHDREDDDGLVARRSSATRRRSGIGAPVPLERPLRADAQRVDPRATTGARSTTTRPTARAWASTARRPAATSSAQYFPTAAAALREHRHDAREPADVVPPRAVGPPHEQRPDRSGTSSSTATRWASST